MPKNIAVILAGGKGIRMGYELPKQFVKVAGRQVIEHTIDVFDRHAGIDEIAVVVYPAFLSQTEHLVFNNKWKKVKKILPGGNERCDSSLAAIMAYQSTQPGDFNLIFHDSVRPLVTEAIITANIVGLETHAAVSTAIPSTDTIIVLSDAKATIAHIPNRDFIRKAQTPQSFKYSTIKTAYDRGLKDANFKVTDDCGVVKKYLPEVPILVVNGSEQNIKLTHKEDLYLINKLLQQRTAASHSSVRQDVKNQPWDGR